MWVEFVVGDDGLIHVVRCKVCSKVQHKDRLFVLKFDNLSKHASKKKEKVIKFSVQPGKFYFKKNSQHVKNEFIIACMPKENVFHLVMKGDGNYDNQKLVQFIELFCIC
jgi:phage-related protein